MKLTNERLLSDVQGLSQLTQKSLPVKVSFAIAKNIAKVESCLKVYNKEKQKLIDKYSVKDDEGRTIIGENNQITIQNEFLNGWNKDIKELNSIENEIDIHNLKISEFEKGDHTMTPGEFMLIDYMIVE